MTIMGDTESQKGHSQLRTHHGHFQCTGIVMMNKNTLPARHLDAVFYRVSKCCFPKTIGTAGSAGLHVMWAAAARKEEDISTGRPRRDAMRLVSFS